MKVAPGRAWLQGLAVAGCLGLALAAVANAAETGVRVEMFPDFVAIIPSGFTTVPAARDEQGAMRYGFVRRQRGNAALCEITVVRPSDLPPPEAAAFPLIRPMEVLRVVIAGYGAESAIAEREEWPEVRVGGNTYAAARLRLDRPRNGLAAAEIYVRKTESTILIVRTAAQSGAILDNWRTDLQRLLMTLSPVDRPAASRAAPAPATATTP